MATGFVVLGGPLADEETVVLAVEAASESNVRATLALDPWSGPTSSSTASMPGRSGSTAGRPQDTQRPLDSTLVPASGETMATVELENAHVDRQQHGDTETISFVYQKITGPGRTETSLRKTTGRYRTTRRRPCVGSRGEAEASPAPRRTPSAELLDQLHGALRAGQRAGSRPGSARRYAV